MVWKCPPLNLFNWNNLWKWKSNMNTCDKCKNYTADDSWKGSKFEAEYAGMGECSLFGDVNEFRGAPAPRNDVCYGWDCEGYSAGVTVMAKFGCIHWEEK